MATYREIAATEVDPNSPLTSTLAEAWRANLLAINEGSAGAPVNLAAWHPYDMVAADDGADGAIYDFSEDGAASSIETPDFEDGYEYGFYFDGLLAASNTTLGMEPYLEALTAYDTAEQMSADLSGFTGFMTAHFPRHAANRSQLTGIAWTNAEPALVVSVGSETATPSKILKMRFVTSNNLSAGKIFMFRRRDYFTG